MNTTGKHTSENQNISSFFEQAPIPMAIMEGSEHVFTFANAPFISLFFSGRDIVGKPAGEVAPETKDQGYINFLHDVYKTGQPVSGEETPLTLIQMDGSQKNYFINFIYQPIFGKEGQVEGIMAVAQDVTVQVEARRTLETQREWLESVLDRMPTALVMLDVKHNRVTFTNSAAKRMLGPTMNDTLPGERYGSTVAVYDKNGQFVPVENIPSARVVRGEVLRHEDLRLSSPSGYYYLSVSSEIVPESFGHKETGMLLLQDVSAMRAAEEQFKLFADLAPQMPFIADADGNIIYYSQQWYRFIGNREGTEGWGWKEAQIIHPEDLQRAIDLWTEALRTGKEYEIEYRLRRHDGVYRWHLGRASAIRDGYGKITKWFGTNVDIHEQKMMQAELEDARHRAEIASDTKSAFLANMSHEIRTPLGAILGFTELLRSTPMSEEAQGYLDVISRSGQALTHVIDDILDLSKVEAGKLVIEHVPFSLQDLIRDVVALFSDKAQSKNLSLSVRTHPTVQNTIFVSDPIRIRQILINLIGNAVKFTTTGGIEVVLRSDVHECDPCPISIEVRDTGSGIDAEQAKHLFQPFVQADQTTSRRHGGTGLGLALSKRLAKMLGGDIRLAQHELCKGSTFILDLQLHKASAEKEEASNSRVSEKKKVFTRRLENKKILVVDDAQDNRTLVSLFLKREGALTEQASSGEEALQKISAHEFDVILMDIQMPGMDGYKTLSSARSSGFAKPVIALTAHAMMEERQKTKAAGFCDHVTKPVDREKLITALLGQLGSARVE